MVETTAPAAAPVRAREAAGSRLERYTFYLVIAAGCAIAIVLLIAPTVIVLITSLTDGYSFRFPPQGYSLRWYQVLWTGSPDIIAAAVLSFKVALSATAISVLLAGAAALGLARRRETWARLLDSAFMSPLMLPPLALGLALLALFNIIGEGLSMRTLVIGHVAITTPYILRTTVASYLQSDPLMLESARCLGARPIFAFRTITLPMIMPGLAAGAFIAFMVSFDNVAISLFLSDARSEVLPIRLWAIIEASLDVRAAAVSGVLIVGTLAVVLLMERVVGFTRYLR